MAALPPDPPDPGTGPAFGFAGMLLLALFAATGSVNVLLCAFLFLALWLVW